MASVYFIKMASDPMMVKIGRAKNPRGRMSDMQVSSPFRLTLIGTIECIDTAESIALEKALHNDFAFSYCRGEWFYYNPEAKQMIDAIIAKRMKRIDKYPEALIADCRNRRRMVSRKRKSPEIRRTATYRKALAEQRDYELMERFRDSLQ